MNQINAVIGEITVAHMFLVDNKVIILTNSKEVASEHLNINDAANHVRKMLPPTARTCLRFIRINFGTPLSVIEELTDRHGTGLGTI